jgi:hypothetical protein
MANLRHLERSCLCSRDRAEPTMLDLLYVLLALASFALFALAVDGCERL